MQNNHPLIKVVFIQKVIAFINPQTLIKDLFQLAYVNNSWNDTVKNYSFHLFEARVRAIRGAGTFENVCARVIQCGVIWFADVLLFSRPVLDRIKLLILVCKNESSSLAMTQLVFDKMSEVGGAALTKKQLIATDNYWMTCLMLACRGSLSVEVVNLVFEKIFEVGGVSLLKSQLTYKNPDSGTCVMHGSSKSSSPEVMKLLFEKIIEVGGKDLLKNQLTSTDVIFGSTCLMLGCTNSSFPEVLKLVFEKILEVGGKDLLRDQLVAADRSGATCLMYAARNYRHSYLFSSVMKLIAVVLVELGLFQEQYAKLADDDKEELSEKADIKDVSWVPDPDSLAEVKKMLKC